jgi:hypothetical protein
VFPLLHWLSWVQLSTRKNQGSERTAGFWTKNKLRIDGLKAGTWKKSTAQTHYYKTLDFINNSDENSNLNGRNVRF